MTSIGREIAALLRSDDRVFQQEAAVKCGISVATYWRWLDGDSEAEQAFQREVLPALYEQAKRAEEEAEQAIGSVPQGSSAWASWYKWKLPQRYRKIFGDLAAQQQTQVNVAVQNNVQVINGKPLDQCSDEELAAYLAEDGSDE